MPPTPSTRNITRVFRTATPEQIETGLAWYQDARRIADELAEAYGVSTEIASGVLAALSPLQSWKANVDLADRFLAAGGELYSGYLAQGLKKARTILTGAPIEATLGGDKTRDFHRCIVAAGKTSDVCVDRHAMAIALNQRHTDIDRPRIKGRRYDEFADRYRRATRILVRETGLEMYPAQVQAITWVTWRHRFWTPGAYDN